jgi:flagellar assembly protein FliH
MTLDRAPGRTTSFNLPSFPSTSAMRDRSVEIAERRATMRDAGFSEGYDEGLHAGRLEAAAEAERLSAAAAAHEAATAALDIAAISLSAAASEFHRRDEVALLDIEGETIALAFELATAIVGRELAACDEPVIDALRRAATLVPDRGTGVVRIHPDDERVVRDATADDPGRWAADMSVVPDAAVERGGCIVDVGSCRVDAQISTALDRLKAVLGDVAG